MELVIISMQPDFCVRLHTEASLTPYKYVNKYVT